VRAFMEKVDHPALKMDDMSTYAETSGESAAEPAAKAETAAKPAEKATAPTAPAESAPLSADDLNEIKEKLTAEIRAAVTKEVVGGIIDLLSEKFFGAAPARGASAEAAAQQSKPAAAPKVTAAERISAVKSFEIAREKWENSVWTVRLGAGREEGGTRGRTYTVGGASCMPFHLWEGQMPNRPRIAMEVFDRVGEKYPALLRGIFKDVLNSPAEMAKVCVEKYGADLISVRLDGTHPERGNRSAAESVELVGSVLKAVDVPLIITGHSHFEKNNEVMKAIAQAYAGENLLFNWVEQDNYRTIAGAAMAYGHTVVSQSPIDVNIGKQMNILLTNMDLKPERIVMDPMTGTIGYGIEYTYSVMERIRLTGLGGDKMLCAPLIVSTGQECAKIKEFKADERAFPAWGELSKRAAIWELSTAVTLLYAGADILIMYHPEAVKSTQRTIDRLMDKGE